MNHKYNLFLHFSIFIFFLGLASFTTNNIKYIYIENALFWSWINVLSLSFITSYSLIFVSSLVQNQYKKFLIYFSSIQTLIGSLFFSYAIQNSYFLHNILIFYSYLVIINSIIALIYIIINVIKKDKNALLFFLGISILVTGAIFDSITIIKLLEYNSLYFNISIFFDSINLFTASFSERKLKKIRKDRSRI